MSDTPDIRPAGWYRAQGDPAGTQRYWNGEKWEGEPQPVPTTPGSDIDGRPLGQPTMRVAARIIDGVIWFALMVGAAAVFAGGALLDPEADVSYGRRLLAGLFGVVLVGIYEVVMVVKKGRTLGKMALGLDIVRLDGAGLDLTTAILRLSPFLVLGVLGAVAGRVGQLFQVAMWAVAIVSVVLVFTDRRRQAVWDKIARTTVVEAT